VDYATTICTKYGQKVQRLSGLGMQLSSVPGETITTGCVLTEYIRLFFKHLLNIFSCLQKTWTGRADWLVKISQYNTGFISSTVKSVGFLSVPIAPEAIPTDVRSA
jgi:hypothetical protein